MAEGLVRRKTYSVDIEKATKPFYNLMMFPYPSAEGLHVGTCMRLPGLIYMAVLSECGV